MLAELTRELESQQHDDHHEEENAYPTHVVDQEIDEAPKNTTFGNSRDK